MTKSNKEIFCSTVILFSSWKDSINFIGYICVLAIVWHSHIEKRYRTNTRTGWKRVRVRNGLPVSCEVLLISTCKLKSEHINWDLWQTRISVRYATICIWKAFSTDIEELEKSNSSYFAVLLLMALWLYKRLGFELAWRLVWQMSLFKMTKILIALYRTIWFQKTKNVLDYHNLLTKLMMVCCLTQLINENSEAGWEDCHIIHLNNNAAILWASDLLLHCFLLHCFM